jgi:hypothetical protein
VTTKLKQNDAGLRHSASHPGRVRNKRQSFRLELAVDNSLC